MVQHKDTIGMRKEGKGGSSDWSVMRGREEGREGGRDGQINTKIEIDIWKDR